MIKYILHCQYVDVRFFFFLSFEDLEAVRTKKAVKLVFAFTVNFDIVVLNGWILHRS